jgi:hypothetical protein
MIRLLLPLLLATCHLIAQPKGKLELFLLIGQSNMAGRGVVEDQDKQPIAGVWMLDKELEWKPAVDPMHFDKPAIIGAGLGRSFARTLLRLEPNAQIGLIPAAFGGTSLEEWAPGGKLFNDAVARTKAALKSGRLRGILWHQGEADSSEAGKATSYSERWVRFITALRSEVGDVPVVVGQLGEFFGKKGESLAGVVNDQLASLPRKASRVAFVSSEGLTHKGDDVHFDSPSLREFGRRYAHAYLQLDAKWGETK